MVLTFRRFFGTVNRIFHFYSRNRTGGPEERRKFFSRVESERFRENGTIQWLLRKQCVFACSLVFQFLADVVLMLHCLPARFLTTKSNIFLRPKKVPPEVLDWLKYL